MTRFYLGLDAGATKTYSLVSKDDGEVLGFGRAGVGNYEALGVDVARTSIHTAITGALQDAGLSLKDITCIGMGVAGADLPEDYSMLEQEIFTPMLNDIPRVFRNDSMACFRGGTRKPYGIVIACGTGCVCAGINPDGIETRVGGINENFGDIVSGTAIGLRSLQAVFQARDGVIPPTLLTDLIVSRAECKDADELFIRMYRNELSQDQLEPLAPLVFEAARKGDNEAWEILEWAGHFLGKVVCAAASRLGMSDSAFDVVMAGSVFKGNSPILKDALALSLHRHCPDANLVMPLYEPVVGALLLALDTDCTIDAPVYERLNTSLSRLSSRTKIVLTMESI